jgi:hypothetical protein
MFKSKAVEKNYNHHHHGNRIKQMFFLYILQFYFIRYISSKVTSKWHILSPMNTLKV